MTPDELTRVLGRLRAGYDKRISDETYAVWCEELTPLEFSPAWAAVRELIHDAKFMPSISEFIAAYGTHRSRQQPHVEKAPCARCDGAGWYITDAERNEVIPCSTCRTEAFETWARGEIPRTAHAPSHGRYTPRTEYDRPDHDTGAADRLRALRDLLPTRAAIRDRLTNPPAEEPA